MSLAALFRQFDPLRPLEAAETDLYVDWQDRLDLADDVKVRLVNGITYTTGPICRLFTGHRGAGKTTELNRVKQRLEAGAAGRRFFVSMLFAEGWVDLGDVQAQDVVFQITRQLVSDLKAVGCGFAETEFREFFARMWKRFRAGIELDGIEVGADPLKLSFRLRDFPRARQQFRELLQGQLPTIFDLVNDKILKPARKQLAGEFDDILVIVDQLDRIPQKLVDGRGLTNHENLFLDHADPLRGLACDVLYTIPIELAYSRCRGRLQEAYGGPILMLPAVPVLQRDGSDDAAGLGDLGRPSRCARVKFAGSGCRRRASLRPLECAGYASYMTRIQHTTTVEPRADVPPAHGSSGRGEAPLGIVREIVRRRAAKAGLELTDVFDTPESLTEALRRSGGHVRGLFVLLLSILERAGHLPLREQDVTHGLRIAAEDLALALSDDDWALLDQIDSARQRGNIDNDVWNALLKERFVLSYQDRRGHWYAKNALLDLAERGG